MTTTQRNVCLAILALFFGGYAIFQIRAGHARDAYEAGFLGFMLAFAVLRIARAMPHASA